jgi:hypothetical protein
MKSKPADRVLGIGHLSNQKHIRLRADDCAETLPEHRVILDAQNADWIVEGHEPTGMLIAKL